MNKVLHTACRIIAAVLISLAGALVSLIVSIPGIVMLIAGYDNPWLVVAAVAYFVIQVSTIDYWMPSSIRNYIEK